MSIESILNSIINNIRTGNLKSAQYDLNTAKNMAPNDFRVWHLDGIVNARIENFQDAISSFKKAFDLGDKEDFEICYFMGYSYMRLEQFENALDYFNKAIEHNDKIGLAFFSKAWTLANLGRTDEALVAAKKALELDPNDDDTKRLIEILES